MKISVPCPEPVRSQLTTEAAQDMPAVGIKISIEGALVSFEFANADIERQTESIDELDANLGLAIADEDRPEMIAALSALKAVVGSLRGIAMRESLYTNARSETAPEQVEEAIDDVVESHLQGEQHTSIEGSSERHGVSPQNEEIDNVEAHEEEPRRRKQRR